MMTTQDLRSDSYILMQERLAGAMAHPVIPAQTGVPIAQHRRPARNVLLPRRTARPCHAAIPDQKLMPLLRNSS
jgi:hypothetical protein